MNKINIKWTKEKELKLEAPSFDLDLKEMWFVNYDDEELGFFQLELKDQYGNSFNTKLNGKKLMTAFFELDEQIEKAREEENKMKDEV